MIVGAEAFCRRATNPCGMTSWTVHCLECADVAAREALMDRFEREHPVAFPSDRYSVLDGLEVDGDRVEADFAWVGRYLYVTTTGDAGDLAEDTMADWERAAVGAFDATTGTAEEVTLVLDPEAGGDGEVAGGRFEGLPGLGGMDVLYALAMRNQFRFRSYSAEPPVAHRVLHPDAFTVVDAVERFVEDMAEATGIEPTAAGLDFLRSDPADDDRYVFGETYGPVDRDFEDAAGDRAPALADDGPPVPDADLPTPEDVLAPAERPSGDGSGGGLVARLRRLLGR